MKRFIPMMLVATVLAAVAANVRADGPGAYRPREKPPAVTPEQAGIDAYNEGYAAIQRADHAENLAATATDETARQQAQRDAQRAYGDALKKFDAATRADPAMFEAHTYIGYANRKLGRYADALQAYTRALRLNPDYPHAIEYQGEAFLGLNRLDEAKFNYLRLYGIAPAQADKLLAAMQKWIETHSQAPPGDVDMEGFSSWVSQRRAATPAHGNEPGSTGSW